MSIDTEIRLRMLRAKLLAARAHAHQLKNSTRMIFLISASLEILRVITFTYANSGGLFRSDWQFVIGTERWLSEYFHDVDSEEWLS